MMDSLPNEIIVNMAQYLHDCVSLCRWAQTSHRYHEILADNGLWNGHFNRDFPTVEDWTPSLSWRELYAKQIRSKRQFYQEFPEFWQIGEYVTPEFVGGWVDVYKQAQINPVLLQPAINRMYNEIKARLPGCKIRFETELRIRRQLRVPVTQGYLFQLDDEPIDLVHNMGFIISLSNESSDVASDGR
jgi:hypothetical protein